MVIENYRQGQLHFTTEIEEALKVCDVCFIAVGMLMGEDGSADLQYQTRSFCYVDDLIDGMMRMMNSAEGFYGPVNLGNPGEFTMLQLAQKMTALTGSRSQLVFKELPSDDPVKRKPVIELAEKELGWKP